MQNSIKGYLYALTAVLLWSTVATAFKLTLRYLDVYQMVFIASLVSSLVLLVPILIQRQMGLLLNELRTYWKRSIGFGLLNPLVYYLVLFAAYDRLPAQVAQPVNYTWALVLVFFSIIFLKQKPTRYDVIAGFLGYSGVVIIATRGEFNQFAHIDGFGMTLAIASTLIWAGYWILNMLDKRDSRVALCLNFICALPISLLVCFLFSDFHISTEGYLGAIYIGCFEMGLAFLCWSRALQLADNTSRVSTLIFLSPFLSLVFISEILDEPIFTSTYLGLIIIVVALLIQKIPLFRSNDLTAENV